MTARYPSGGRTRLGMLVGAYRTAARLIQAQRQASWVVTTQDPFEAGLVGWLTCRRFGLPLNIQEHGDFFSTPHWRNETALNRVRFYVGRYLIRRADTVRVVSKRIWQTLTQLGVAETRLRLLPVTIPLERFVAAERAPQGGGEVVILSVARFVPQKNLGLLLEAFARVVSLGQKARLVLVGNGPEEQKLRALATILLPTQAEAITWLPWSDDVPALMAEADIYALSSNYEGYARVVPEAMATGLPVIMTDVGCAHELLVDGLTGLITPVGDVSAYSTALIELVYDSEKRRQLAEAGKQVATTALSGQEARYGQAWAVALT
jgi:glycosyltransferase involved in cell wall biosynthesis